MFKNKKKSKKQKPTLLHVEIKNNSVERALSEFKKRVKNSNLLKELRDREFYTKPSVIKKTKITKSKISSFQLVFLFLLILIYNLNTLWCTESNKINP